MMAGKAKPRGNHQQVRLGDLASQYKFFLNPYTDVRFTTSCPGCRGKMRQRKLPLAIHVHDGGMVVLNKTCRFCPCCDLLIAHKDEIEGNLAQLFARTAPPLIGSDFFVVGTFERNVWRRGLTESLPYTEMRGALHDFKEHLHYKLSPSWQYTDARE